MILNKRMSYFFLNLHNDNYSFVQIIMMKNVRLHVQDIIL